MKTLKESLFDKDLIKRDPTKDIIDVLKNIDKVSVRDVLDAFEKIKSIGDIYDGQEIYNHKVDLKKNVLVVIRDFGKYTTEDPSHVVFFFVYNNKIWISDITCYHQCEYWNTRIFSNIGSLAWNGLIKNIKFYYGAAENKNDSNCKYLVLPEGIGGQIRELICDKHKI